MLGYRSLTHTKSFRWLRKKLQIQGWQAWKGGGEHGVR